MKFVAKSGLKHRQKQKGYGVDNMKSIIVQFMFLVVCSFSMYAQAAEVETVTYYHTDMLGSPVAASNENGEILWEERYLPYGESEFNLQAEESNTIGYTGHRKEDSGLVYMQARYYDPVLGRFISTDPAGFSESNYQTFNRYAYANNNPNSFYDPNGEVANFALKFIADVGLNLVINYATTGSPNLGMALKDSAMDAFNPAATLKKAKKIGQLIKTLNKDKKANIAESAGGLCFVEGTPVHTQDGLKPIEAIQVGDIVASKDEVTGVTTWKPVVKLFVNSDKQILNVTLVSPSGAEILGVTPEHPFYVKGRAWVEAKDLVVGDEIVTLNGEQLLVEGVEPDKERHTTYNFEVTEYHSYFVGDVGAWVHNQCAVPIGGGVGGKITGYTKHGLNQVLGRNGGRGVSAKHMLDAVKNPKKVVEGANGAIKYQGKKAAVVLNSEGKVITAFGKSRGPQIWKQGTTRASGSGSAQRRANETGFSYNPKAIR